MNPNWLAEGLCPTHGTPLERTPEYGWCEECWMGFSLTPDAITLHLRRRAKSHACDSPRSPPTFPNTGRNTADRYDAIGQTAQSHTGAEA